LRKIDMLRATWIARFRDDAGKHKYKSIGLVTTEFGFDQAKVVASEWFKLQVSGVKTTEIRSVADACKAYVKSLTLTNGAAGARDAELRLRRTVYQSDLGRKSLSSVRITHVKSWRNGLKLKAANSNRTLTSLKAALNMAVANRQCVAILAIESNEVQPLQRVVGRVDLPSFMVEVFVPPSCWNSPAEPHIWRCKTHSAPGEERHGSD